MNEQTWQDIKMYPRHYIYSSRLEFQVKKQILVGLLQQLRVGTTLSHQPLLLKCTHVEIQG